MHGMKFDPEAYRKIRDPLSKPVKCPVCLGGHVSLQRNRVIYGKDYGRWPLIWYCHGCEAMVGCHPGTDVPLGYMADQPTRRARMRAHQAFDPLWKGNNLITRREAYKRLADYMGLPERECHISMFNEYQCTDVIRFVKENHSWLL